MSSMDGLKRRIEAGDYEVDARKVAGAIVDKLALIKRAQRELERAEAEEGAPNGPTRASKRRGGRGATPTERSSRRTANGRS